MLRRLYVDNYKCLVNLECRFDHLNLILGCNGSGKSTVFDAIRDVRDFVNGKSPIKLFNDHTLTRWDKRDLQVFELEVEGNGGIYQYRLEIEHEIGEEKQRVKTESVMFDGGPLYRAELDEVQLYRDNHSTGPQYPKDWSQSGLLFLGERRDNSRVTWLKNWFKEKLLCLRIEPTRIEPMWPGEDRELDKSCANFVGFYRHLIQSRPTAMLELFAALRELYDGFGELKLEQEGGTVRHLYAILGVTATDGRPENIPLSFAELSDGERALTVLYTLLSLMSDPELTLCIDEPDNYVALAEIQPWLISLKDRVDIASAQALLISHHPELIDYLAPECGLVFERTNNGPARVRSFQSVSSDGSKSASEIVARGWE